MKSLFKFGSVHKQLMKSLSHRLIRAGLAQQSEIKGCSSAEIAEITEHAGRELPEVYKAFLRQMGKGAGWFFRGTTFFYPELLRARRGALELLQDDGEPFRLSEFEFVFSEHQGYQFMYFPLGDEEDPPVYLYQQGHLNSEKLFGRFSDFLIQAADDLVAHAPEFLPSRRGRGEA